MRSRRVPVLKLGSRGPGGDARSYRCVRKASAKRSRRVGHAGESTESKIVAKRRTVVTFYVSHYKSVNSHRDRGGRGRETQNSRHFWTRLGSSRLKRAKSHRDRGGRVRETQNCRHFWTRLWREERREEKREMRGEKREERREERRETRGERRKEREERREERREKRGEKREEREEKTEERGESG